MNKQDVIKILTEHEDPRGVKHWNEKVKSDLSSFGIGLTILRKIAKQIGQNHDLALELWKSKNHDVKTIGLLIDDPKLITEEQAELQVESVRDGHLAHVFSACGAPLGKTKFVQELAMKWIESDDNVRIRCGYGLIYEESKSKRKNAPSDAFFMNVLQIIETTYNDQPLIIRGAIGGALIGIGKRNPILNKETIRVTDPINPIHYTVNKTGCEPIDVMKHLTSSYLKQKFSA